jgi:predicted nucleic acid-binding protein
VVLVDTSVWIEVFRKPARFRLDSTVDFDEIVTCLPVVHAVLQGFHDDRAFSLARDSMLALPIVESPLRREVFLEATELYRRARRSGRTIRSGVDCLIAACAIRNSLSVLHRDRDFDSLAKISGLDSRSLSR